MTNTHKHYELARRAHYNTSFTPDKRAESFCTGFDATIAELAALAIDQHKIEKYESLVVAHLQAKSRCMSSMIAGPANFPIRRAEKANNAEHARSMECSAYYDKIVKEAKQEAYYTAHPEARPVMSNDENAVEKLQSKLAALVKAQETMVAANKIIRKQPIDRTPLIALLGNETVVDSILKPDCFGGLGFATFQLSNNRASIKQVETRIAEITKRKEATAKDIVINGVRVLENTESMRLQLFFEGKPDTTMITLLKSHGFKWSPSNMAWQRQLTNNAVYSFNHWILPALKDAEVAA